MFTEPGSLFNQPDWPPMWVLLGGLAIIFLVMYVGRDMGPDEIEEDKRDDEDVDGGKPCPRS